MSDSFERKISFLSLDSRKRDEIAADIHRAIMVAYGQIAHPHTLGDAGVSLFVEENDEGRTLYIHAPIADYEHDRAFEEGQVIAHRYIDEESVRDIAKQDQATAKYWGDYYVRDLVRQAERDSENHNIGWAGRSEDEDEEDDDLNWVSGEEEDDDREDNPKLLPGNEGGEYREHLDRYTIEGIADGLDPFVRDIIHQACRDPKERNAVVDTLAKVLWADRLEVTTARGISGRIVTQPYSGDETIDLRVRYKGQYAAHRLQFRHWLRVCIARAAHQLLKKREGNPATGLPLGSIALGAAVGAAAMHFTMKPKQ